MNFVALDVETANPDRASICQIGIAKFVDGELAEEWSTLIDPEDYFFFANIDIHGITPDDVAGSPTFPEIVEHLHRFLTSSICSTHTSFDRVSISRAVEKYRLPSINTTWLDSARVARRTWEEVAWKGYGLHNVCNKIGHEFKHHDALEDAKASGHIIIAAIKKSGLNLSEWLNRVDQPIDPTQTSDYTSIRRDGNPEGDMHGEAMVFTGALDITRREAADLAAVIGCKVIPNVTKKTTILVVGDQDISRLAGKEKSRKHLKAEQLIKKGQRIKIIGESDFKRLVEYTSEPA